MGPKSSAAGQAAGSWVTPMETYRILENQIEKMLQYVKQAGIISGPIMVASLSIIPI